MNITPVRETAKQFFGWHETLVSAMVVLVVVHALAGLKHLLVDRDASSTGCGRRAASSSAQAPRSWGSGP